MAEAKGLKYMQVITSSVKNRTYTFAIFTLMVVIVLLIGAIRPTIVTITRINKEIKEKSDINDRLDQKINNLALLTNEYSTLINEINELPLVFPTQGNFSLFMSNVEELARNNGFELTSINFNSPDEQEINTNALSPWNARLSLVGKKSNFIKMLDAIESMPMYPEILQVSFSNKPDERGLTSYNVQVKIHKVDDPKFYE